MTDSLLIIIPCFNEYNKLDVDAYLNFLSENKTCNLLFSNDGSTDATLTLLEKIQEPFPERVTIFSSEVNQGKAEAVRAAVHFSFETKITFEKIAYLDADLSVSLEECMAIAGYVKDPILLAFGSRIKKIDTNIERKKYRHYIGRIIATAISYIIKIPIYDTQCGCKVFEANLAKSIFEEKFISKWLFDVELFCRIIETYSREKTIKISREIPLQRWKDTNESKVKLTYFFKIWIDLLKINKRYNEKN
ncbi:glycosyltransferase [Gaetbulibacter aestuarii]|uniref:Glycosyltransferase n=1 Tax=Gaetbulibacter aestuarii TaxID=1502358 RepID=A0ABW7N0C8_9FLAO